MKRRSSMEGAELRSILQNCSLHAFLLLTSRTLTRLGYGDVEVMDRRTRAGKTRYGGHELLCEGQFGDRPVRVIVKVLLDSIRVRNVDELAGTVVRTGADSGIVVSPFHVSRPASKALDRYGPVRIGAVDGDKMAHWLTQLRIGVREGGTIDYVFFSQLEEHSDLVLSLLERIEQ